jgi:hypothetical protein
MGIPGLIGSIRLPVPGYLAIHTLEGLANPLGNVFDPFTTVKAISNLDAVGGCPGVRGI